MGALATPQARLESLGYTVEDHDFRGGNQAIYLNDPDDNGLELTERATLWDGSPAS